MKHLTEKFIPMWELNPLWATLTEEERKIVAQHVEIVQYEKNEQIRNEGEESQYIWMLLSGKNRT